MGQRSIAITTSNFDMTNPLLDEFRSDGWDIVRSEYGRRLTEEEVSTLLSQAGVVGMVAGVEPLTEAVFSANPDLRVISRCGTGFDSVDRAAADSHGIVCVNTPNAPAAAVAELTLGLMMTVLRRIGEVDRNLRAGTWKALMGSLLAKRTVGIVGLGRVGRRVADLVSAFGAVVKYYDPQVATAEYDRVASAQELASQVDVLTIHVPMSEANRNLVNAEVVDSLPEGAIVVNAARGGIVDEVAVVAALQSGKLSGAAFDVFEQEPYEGPLCDFDNVVLTAHMGSYAREARQLMESEALLNLLNALREIEGQGTT
jgi:D-3-phosphoglycerate dehydrogenase